MSDWHFTRTRCSRVKWFIPGIHYDVLVVHASDVYADEGPLVIAPDEASELARDWIEDSLFTGELNLHDVLDEFGLASFAPEFQHSAIRRALRKGDLVALKLSARTSMLRRIASLLANEERERDRREAEAHEALWKNRPRAAPPAPDPSFYRYRVSVLDDTGAPIAGVRLKLDIDGTPKMPTTDDEGLAVAEWFSKGPARARLLDQSEVVRNLEPRWAAPRSPSLPKGPEVHELPVDEACSEISISPDVETTLILTRRPVRRVRLVGMLFDANRCFLLPQALPGVRTIIALHRERPRDRVLIVGHAGGDEHRAGMELALGRAEILRGYLTNKPEAWMKWFDRSKPSYARWGTREVQLMLSVLPAGGTAYYEGYASGVSDAKTVRAVKAFQKAKGLAVDGKAGPNTLTALVSSYMDLEDTTLGRDIDPVVHGCEGHFEDTETEEGLQPDDRRMEVFFFAGEIAPKPAGSTSQPGATEYPAWRSAVVETRDFEHHGIHVQIIDSRKRPVPFANVHLEGPTSGDAVADEHGFVSFFGLVRGEYTMSGTLEGRQVSRSKLRYPTAKTVADIQVSYSRGTSEPRAANGQ